MGFRTRTLDGIMIMNCVYTLPSDQVDG